MHTNGRVRTMSATTQARQANASRNQKANRKGEATNEMGPAVIILTTLVVGAIMTSGKLLIWVTLAGAMWFVYERISATSRILLVAATAATAVSFFVPHVTAWF